MTQFFQTISGEKIIARKEQNLSNKDSYIYPGDGSCHCGSCSLLSGWAGCGQTDGIDNYHIGNVQCCGGFCTSQPECMIPDFTQCEIGKSSENLDPLVNFGWDQKAPNLFCEYNIKDIDTIDQINKFKLQFREIPDSLFQTYCSEKVKTCPDGIGECSRLKSIDLDGSECRNWLSTLTPSQQDSVISTYCLLNNTDDCKCVNRNFYDSYQKLKSINPYNDGCWYAPCSDTQKNLVPSHLLEPDCPDNICQVIFDIYDTGNVSFDDIKNDISCNFPETSISKKNFKFNEDFLLIPIIIIIIFLFMK